MDSIGTPTNTHFTSLPSVTSGSGISITTNHAISLSLPTKGLQESGANPTGRQHVADIQIDFNVPIANPVLHFVGLGGTASSKGFVTEFDLLPALSTGAGNLTRLSGNAAFAVSGNQINNNVPNAGASCGTTSSASCGSVAVGGSAVTRVYLRAYIRSNQSIAWSSSATAGDAFQIGVSGEVSDMTATISGTPASVTAGTTYPGLSVTCTNNGPNFARSTLCQPIVSAGTVSALTCNPAVPNSLSYANGSKTITCSFSYALPTGGPYPTSISFSAATGAGNDRNGGAVLTAGNNSSTPLSRNVVAAALVSSRKTVSVHSEQPAGCGTIPGTPDPAAEVVIPGACLHYVIRLENYGTVTAPGLNLTDILDTRLIFAGATLSGVTTTAAGYAFNKPAAQTDCAVSTCTIRIQNGILPARSAAEILIRAIMK
ncbi:hypothetical protein [Cereibacter sphaeroides]|nr:hypothetical protein [Cereibacter sphaeroides]